MAAYHNRRNILRQRWIAPSRGDIYSIHFRYGYGSGMTLASSSSLSPSLGAFLGINFHFDIGLDNLPHEVHHLLSEIKLKDQKCQGWYLI